MGLHVALTVVVVEGMVYSGVELELVLHAGLAHHVAEARDTGAPWLLDDGSEERNPIEQVSRQQDAVR
ncbi:hypothetical protein QEH68_11915 [Paenarthrobacter sp. OM7]|uniref:hypothetical protein n=1 Tax=Paenarthrobacter sp. OM7 TaxID=3041264 RepID=UPI0024684465|nr:hypothetical protein [Paenarthrobacter sp. OM7]WGM18764.1 hypothetical protein QEH68_11915 [Paenarthrobacter sp. OM7]